MDDILTGKQALLRIQIKYYLNTVLKLLSDYKCYIFQDFKYFIFNHIFDEDMNIILEIGVPVNKSF